MAEDWDRLPDPRFLELKTELVERARRRADGLAPADFGAMLDPIMIGVLEEGFAQAGAGEGTVWLVDSDGQHLVPAFNNGPHAAQMVGVFRQPLDAGLICMVFASEQPFVENEVFKNARQSKLLDRQLNVQTHALMAVPFSFAQACRGVISCVQLKEPGSPAPDPPGFRREHLIVLQRVAAVLSRLIDFRLLSCTLGLSTP